MANERRSRNRAAAPVAAALLSLYFWHLCVAVDLAFPSLIACIRVGWTTVDTDGLASELC